MKALGEEVQAKDLKEGDELATADGDTATVDSVECIHHDEPVMVYNIAVCDDHTYFVGENSVLVHNMCRTAPSEDGTQNVKPEAAVQGSKKHGVNWNEGPARANSTGKPQGQWAKSDLDYATEMANTLPPGESGYFNLPEGAESIVHMPDGTTIPATRAWIRNNGTGTWHGYPME